MTAASLALIPSPVWAVLPYRPDDLRMLALQSSQAELSTFIGANGFAEQVGASGEAWTAFAEGRPIACCGFQYPWTGRAIAWAVLSHAAGPHMRRLTTACREAFDRCSAERIEATVVDGFVPGMRWVAMLGFEYEGKLRRYCRGDDYLAYARLKTTP